MPLPSDSNPRSRSTNPNDSAAHAYVGSGERTPFHQGPYRHPNYSSMHGDGSGGRFEHRQDANGGYSQGAGTGGLPRYQGDGDSMKSASDHTQSTSSTAQQAYPGSSYQSGALWAHTRLPASKSSIRTFLAVFALGWLISWVIQDFWAMAILNPGATERRKIVWDRQYAKHQAEVIRMNEITAKWSREIEQHDIARRAMSAERKEWDKERALWRVESHERERLQLEAHRIELEKQNRELERQKDEEARKKAGVRWQDPSAGQCVRFGTRKYTSTLENVPEDYNRIKACHETQAWIKGRWLFPTECNDQGLWGGVIGTWVTDHDEAGCNTFWQEFKDKGCTAQGSGKRRIESQLQNLQGGDDGTAMCSTTPAAFHGLRFDAPHSCVYWGKYGFWGIWFIEDGSCR